MSDWRLGLYRGKWAAIRGNPTVRVSLRTADLSTARRRFEDFIRQPVGDTVGELVTAYLAEKDKTAIRAVDLHGSWKRASGAFAHLRPDQVTREVCRAYARRRYKDGVGANTVRKELECVRAAINYHKRPGAVFELPPKPAGRDRYLTRDEARRLSRAARGYPHVRAFIVLSLCTAARPSALLSLTWNRVDLKRGVASLAIGDDLDDQRKTRARVPLNKRACRYLRVLRAARTCDHVIEWGGHKVLSIKKGFKAAARRANLPGVTPYTLRHTAASWMAEADVPILDIAKMLGHGDTRITERTYAHLRPSHLQKAARSLKW